MKPMLLVITAQLLFACTIAQPRKLIIYFDHDRSGPGAANLLKLDSLAEQFRKQGIPERVMISGHCDSDGSDGYNMRLSERRVQSVKQALAERMGDLGDRIDARFKGESEPVADNGTDAGKMQNRRVEISYDDNTVINVAEPPKEEPKPPKEQPKTLEEKVERSNSGDNIVLKNLNFVGGLRQLLPTSEPVLNELLQVMKDHPSLQIDIQGHICCVNGPGDGPDLQTGVSDLSVQRAKAVYDFLVANGIQSSRLSFRGYGHQYPLTQERTAEEQEQNRRVEIKIVKK